MKWCDKYALHTAKNVINIYDLVQRNNILIILDSNNFHIILYNYKQTKLNIDLIHEHDTSQLMQCKLTDVDISAPCAQILMSGLGPRIALI